VLKKCTSVFGRGISIFLIVFLNVILALNILTILSIKRVEDGQTIRWGYACAIVGSASMSGSLNVGDFVIIRSVDTYQKGDIASYVTEQGMLVTHRVEEVFESEYLMKGDRNNTSDGKIHRQRFLGRVDFIVPKVGLVGDVFLSPIGLVVLLSFPVGIYFIYYFAKKMKEEMNESQ